MDQGASSEKLSVNEEEVEVADKFKYLEMKTSVDGGMGERSDPYVVEA